VSILLLAVFNLLRPFVKTDISYLIFAAAVMVFVSGLPKMGKSFKTITAVFSLSGAALLFYGQQPFFVWATAFNSMTNVVTILVVMQMFSVPMEVGNYDTAVQYMLNKAIKSKSTLFLVTTAVTHIFTSFLMFGSIPIVVSLLNNMVKNSVIHYKRFIAMAASRGYALTSLWAPGAINLFLVVEATNVSWLEIFIPGLILGIIGIVTSYLLERNGILTPKYNGEQTDTAIEKETVTRFKARVIGGVVLCLIIATMVLDYVKIGSSSTRIALAGTGVISLWMFSLRKKTAFNRTLKKYWQEGLLKPVDTTILFLAMGLFSTAIAKAGVLDVVQFYLQNAANILGLYSVVLLPLLIILTSLIGIHPFISLVLVGQVLTSLHLPLTSVTLALCLALGGSISYMASPFAGVILILAKYIGCTTRDITLRWNWKFCLLYYLEGILFACLWGQYFYSM
jgi:hypothetical protein